MPTTTTGLPRRIIETAAVTMLGLGGLLMLFGFVQLAARVATMRPGSV